MSGKAPTVISQLAFIDFSLKMVTFSSFFICLVLLDCILDIVNELLGSRFYYISLKDCQFFVFNLTELKLQTLSPRWLAAAEISVQFI